MSVNSSSAEIGAEIKCLSFPLLSISNYRQDDDGDGSWDLIQNRANHTVNEVTNITESAGPSWITPAYDAAANMTTIPKPADPTVGLTGIYDAWNQLVALKEGGDFVAEYAYDPTIRRTIQKTYTSGVLSETRHFFYTEPSKWQVIEERIGTSPDSADAERQFVWGLRYIDDLVLRERDTDGNGSLDERLYALQDANWNVTAVTNANANSQERYAYTAYGVPIFLDAAFGSRASSSYQWETLFAGYRWDPVTKEFHVRHRVDNPLVSWLQRGPHSRLWKSTDLYEYCSSTPTRFTDPKGLWKCCSETCCWSGSICWNTTRLIKDKEPCSPSKPCCQTGSWTIPFGYKFGPIYGLADATACPGLDKALDLVNSVINAGGACQAFFDAIENPSCGPFYISLASWSPACLLYPTYTYPVTPRTIYVCPSACSDYSPEGLASLIIHELAHKFCGLAEECPLNAQKACEKELLAGVK